MAFDTNSFSFGIKVWGFFLTVNPDINSLFSVTVFKVNLAGLLDYTIIAFYQNSPFDGFNLHSKQRISWR